PAALPQTAATTATATATAGSGVAASFRPAAAGQPLARPGFTPTGERIGRNDACWCGSGLKYKKCHGR
ncbi:MAG TPA: SEC-C metal-binding domain-containing protein, partial [Candidatus Limnocylindrales bacterium]